MSDDLTHFDVAEHLADDPEGLAELLRDAGRSGHTGYIAHALGIVARAKGMTQVAQATGMGRQALYRALSESGNPTLATVTEVAKALGYRISFEPIEKEPVLENA